MSDLCQICHLEPVSTKRGQDHVCQPCASWLDGLALTDSLDDLANWAHNTFAEPDGLLFTLPWLNSPPAHNFQTNGDQDD